MEKSINLIKRGEEADEHPFVGKRTFFHDDPNESEETRIEATKVLAKFSMARYGVRGISYTGHGYSYVSLNASLSEGEDYKIIVGEKIIHEQPRYLTFDDIKAL